ncbi:M1 family metallopeptidase [Chengkuizengella axinellae]|uniref:M1 family metallopeptidase n=1 Tax=Chengkuizengella axinellae TaxID=3064388 RepID=A0ABT9J5N5_9BACL|nr:M1 family metallopeptidase [Chengkuizengella sp. 2205SS18-9]MDP5276269.1 M1 family metallopeptidase [Chengkuizengella sp. 2205SS18-9]
MQKHFKYGFIIIGIFLFIGIFMIFLNDSPESTSYSIDLELDEQGTFHVKAEIAVTNNSEEAWTDIGFYFVPNALTEKYKPDFMVDSAELKINKITVNDKEQPYSLNNNIMLVSLDKDLKTKQTSKVMVDYTLNLPIKGNRLSKFFGNYYLAQWYPMLGDYNSGWVIYDYDARGESYFTGYGDYEISYMLPKEYFVASSGKDGEILPSQSGIIKGDKIKDFYLALLDPLEWESQTEVVQDTELRVFMPAGKEDMLVNTSREAKNIFKFFEERIGDNPNAEIDLVGNNGNMEYPNVMEISDNEEIYEHILTHELAHQWFYYLVSNDPYSEAWLDEGIAEFAASLYLTEKYNEQVGFEFANRLDNMREPDDIVNKQLHEFENYITTVYSRAPMKLWSYFRELGGTEEALNFLSAYYNDNQYKVVDSEVFIDYFNEYFEQDHSSFFEEWIDLNVQ